MVLIYISLSYGIVFWLSSTASSRPPLSYVAIIHPSFQAVQREFSGIQLFMFMWIYKATELFTNKYGISQHNPHGLSPAKRHKSTVASVCPLRSNIPFFLASNGNIWPGRRKSSGFTFSPTQARAVIELPQSNETLSVPPTTYFPIILSFSRLTNSPTLRPCKFVCFNVRGMVETEK